jgi:uncharacterized membrane protein YccF (DUF307 family)
MATLGNLIWFVCGGWLLGALWWIGGVLFGLTGIGAPFAVACWRIAWFAWWPFGKDLLRKPNRGAGTALAGIVWLLIFGWWLALLHLFAALLHAASCLAILPILWGAPIFAVGNARLAWAALQPLGYEIVDREVGRAVRVHEALRRRGMA